MEITPGLVRPTLSSSRRRTAAIAVACSAGLLTIGVAIGKLLANGSMVPIAAPVFVDVPQVPAPAVTVNVPPPAPVIVPPEPPPAAPPPAPRALAPHLDAGCLLLPEGSAEPPAACAWDGGFPAISADGALVVEKIYTSEPSGMFSGLSISFFDVATSRVARTEVVQSEKDYDAEGKLRPGAAQRIERRAAAVQRTLDAGQYRSLIALGSSEPSAAVAGPKQIHAQVDGGAVRIVDPDRAAALWQHRFSAGVPRTDPNDTSMCGGQTLRHLDVWWDRPTGIVLTDLTYTTGGCMCPTVHAREFHRIPAAALAR